MRTDSRLKLEAKVKEEILSEQSAKRSKAMARLREQLEIGKAQLAKIQAEIDLRRTQIETFVALQIQTLQLSQAIETQIGILEEAAK